MGVSNLYCFNISPDESNTNIVLFKYIGDPLGSKDRPEYNVQISLL